ncbi:RING finger protein [Rutstroemia sp. NJR-2017a WRK4]|nr:RING finger protein [Rutstroemia sp. NJR-2017a WRK4]
MADSPFRSGSAGAAGHLDATGPREVVFCHQCENEWYQDEHGLICPACEGEIIEIVDPASDPRPGINNHNDSPALSPMDRDSLIGHNPWAAADESDPDEADIEEHITRGPGGSIYISQTIRSNGPLGRPFTTRRRRNQDGDGGEDDIMRDFHSILGGLMGPTLRGGPPGRSGPDTLFQGGSPGFRFTGGVGGGPGPAIANSRVTFTGRLENGRFRRDPDNNGGQAGDAPGGDLATLITDLFSQMGAVPAGGVAGEGGEARRAGMGAAGLPGLLASIFNPANAIHGDAVYSQEALDRIMSQLMEQHQSSNAPGPAPPDAIAALPKKKLDEKMLGPEHTGECSVCMDDVHLNDEVVVLPCNHWFHETCASAWLSEHNTCPICRKGITSEETPTSPTAASNSRRSSYTGTSASASRNEARNRRLSNPRPTFRPTRSDSERQARNEARLDAIRFGRTPPPARSASFQGGVADMDNRGSNTDFASSSQSTPPMPGGFPSGTPPRRDSGLGSSSGWLNDQRDSRRGLSSRSERERDRERDRQSERSNSDGEGNANHGGLGSWIRRFGGGGRGRGE